MATSHSPACAAQSPCGARLQDLMLEKRAPVSAGTLGAPRTGTSTGACRHCQGPSVRRPLHPAEGSVPNTGWTQQRPAAAKDTLGSRLQDAGTSLEWVRHAGPQGTRILLDGAARKRPCQEGALPEGRGRERGPLNPSGDKTHPQLSAFANTQPAVGCLHSESLSVLSNCLASHTRLLIPAPCKVRPPCCGLWGPRAPPWKVTQWTGSVCHSYTLAAVNSVANPSPGQTGWGNRRLINPPLGEPGSLGKRS